uniref:Uncharacterized protein n=1 Tax=Anguilla anguilla TaxID=7936 RepID=A0A0E9UNM3_ANGAN
MPFKIFYCFVYCSNLCNVLKHFIGVVVFAQVMTLGHLFVLSFPVTMDEKELIS